MQIEKSQIINNLRIVNFDTYYLPNEENLYLTRLNLVKSITLFYCGKKSPIVKFFDIINGFNQHRLPLYFGIESKNEVLLPKLYLNFFNLLNQDLKWKILATIFNKLGIRLLLNKEKNLCLFGMTLDKDRILDYKLYYIYNKKSNLNKFGFTSHELNIFHWLNQRNKLDYFAITERYSDKQLLSKKIEIQPKNYKNFLKQFSKASNTQALFPKIQKIIHKTNGTINMITIEGHKLTIYVRLLNYRQKNF